MTSRCQATDRTTTSCQNHNTALCSYLATDNKNAQPQETKFDLSFYTSHDTGHVTHFTAPEGAVDADCDYVRRALWSSCFSHPNMDYHQNQQHHSDECNYSNSIPDMLHRISSLEDMQIPQNMLHHGKSPKRRADRKSVWLSPYESISTAATTPNPFQQEAVQTELGLDTTLKEVLDGVVTSAADLWGRANQNRSASLHPLETTQTSNSSSRTTKDVIGTRSLMFQPETPTELDAVSMAPPMQGYNNMLPSLRVADTQTPRRQSARLPSSNMRKGFLPRFQYTQRR